MYEEGRWRLDLPTTPSIDYRLLRQDCNENMKVIYAIFGVELQSL